MQLGVLECEICGEILNDIGDMLVCDNGHTLTNASINVEGGNFKKGQKQVIYKEKVVKKLKTTGEFKVFYQKNRAACFEASVLFFKAIFDEMIKLKVIKEDFIFKYYTGFFKSTQEAKFKSISEIKEEIMDDELFTQYSDTSGEKIFKRDWPMSIIDLFSLLYLQIRAEYEASGKIFLLENYIELVNSDKFVSIYTKCADKQLKPPLKTIILSYRSNILCYYTVIENRVKIFGNANTDVITFFNSIKLKVPSNSLEDARIKFLIRSRINYTYPIGLKYTKKLLKVYKIDKIVNMDNLSFYLKKLIYTRDPTDIFVPEIEYSIFIALYVLTFHKEEYGGVKEKVEGYISISDLNAIISKRIFFYEMMVDPESYMEYINMNRSNRLNIVNGVVKTIGKYVKE